MFIPGIKDVSVSTNVYSYDDFLVDTDKIDGGMVSNNKIYSAPSFIKTGVNLKNGVRPVKLYNVNGKVHLYCTDGKVYKKTEKGYKAYNIATLTLPPKIFSILKDGQTSVVITADKGGYVINDTFSYLGVPTADCYAIYKGVLFCATGRRISIYASSDYTGYNIDFNNEKFINIQQSLGSVKKLVPTSIGLYVFCLRGIAVIKLSVDEIGFSVKRPYLEIIKPIPESIKAIGDVAYFTCADGFYFFDGEKVQKIKSIINDITYSIIGEAISYNDNYLLPISVCGKKQLYCYDVVNEVCGIIKYQGDLITDGGYSFNLDGEESELLLGNPNEFTWESKKTDYNTQKQKTLCGIYVNSKNPVTISVISEQAVKRFTTTGGIFSAALSVRSKYYKIRVTGDQNAHLLGLKVKYKYQGE